MKPFHCDNMDTFFFSSPAINWNPFQLSPSFLSSCQRSTKLHFLPSYKGCNLYPTPAPLTYNSQFKMRSCVCGCVWVRRWLHEIVPASRSGCIRQCCHGSYGQAFSGSVFGSELITLVQCDCVRVCLPVCPFPANHHDQGRGLLHQSPTSTSAPFRTTSLLTTGRWHSQYVWTRSHVWPIETLPQQVSFRSAPQTTNPLRQKNELACVSEYKQIIRQTGLPANACHSLGLIGVLTTIQPYCLE